MAIDVGRESVSLCTGYSGPLQVLHIELDGLLQSSETILTEILLQNFLSTRFRKDSAQILAIVLAVFGHLLVWTNLAQGGKDCVPSIRLGKGKDTFILDVGVDESGNMETGSVTDVHKPFCQIVSMIFLNTQYTRAD